MGSRTPPRIQNVLWLNFQPDHECAFRRIYYDKSINHVRLALVLAVFFYAIFGILDAQIAPGAKEKLWFIRFGVFLPWTVGVLLFTFSEHFRRAMQLMCALTVFVAGFGIICMIVITTEENNQSYYAGLILVLMYGYTFFKLRWIWASTVGLLVVLGYEVAAIAYMDTPVHILINNNFFFITANVFGMFACYAFERYTRMEYINTALLNIERENINRAKRNLEKHVSERTQQLVQINDDLRSEIEDRKRIERALKKSEEKHRSLIEDIEEAYFEVNPTGKLVFCNEALSRISGYKPDELIGMGIGEYTSKATVEELNRVFNKIHKTGIPAKLVVFEITKKTGERCVVEMSASLMRDEAGKSVGFRGLVRDVTERNRAQEALREAKEAAEAANMAKSNFLATMSHELRTPMNAIIGFSELLLDHHCGELNAVQYDYLTDIHTSAEHLLSLINDILDLSKIESHNMKLDVGNVDLAALLRNSVRIISEKARDTGISICVDIDGLDKPVALDERRIKQVVYNLLSNAVKFTDGGKSVFLAGRPLVKKGSRWVTRDLRPTLVPVASHMALNDGEYVEVSIADEGIGINGRDLERIFNPFEQGDSSASRRYQGTGLGLTLSRRFIELHKGMIWAESDGEGKGSVFRFLIPCAGHADRMH